MHRFSLQFLLFIAMSLSTRMAFGQLAHYPFDACSMQDRQSDTTAYAASSVTCACGLEGDALLFDEDSDSVAINNISEFFFTQDFAVKFYFSDDATEAIAELLTKKTGCLQDSSFSIIYNSLSQSITVELVESLANSIQLFGDLDPDRCWHEVIVQRNGGEYQLILDGVIQDREARTATLQIVNTAPVSLGRGPCTDNIVNPFRGMIDGVSFYTRALSRFEYRTQIRPDRLLTRDTVIFAGDQVAVRSLVNCATQIQWSPNTDISDPNSPNPVLSPLETMTYHVSYRSDQCTSTDTIRVIVIERDDLECDRLDLPTAFSPNGDGLNDDFGFSNPFIIESLQSFDIYDRKGAIVYSLSGINDRWDGRFKGGSKLMPGVYVYKIRYRCQNADFFKIGSVTLIR